MKGTPSAFDEELLRSLAEFPIGDAFPPEEDSLREMFGLVEPIGWGSSAHVYEHPEDNKVIRFSLGYAGDVFDCYQQFVALALKSSNPHFPVIYGNAVAGERSMTIMELLHEADIGTLSAEQQLAYLLMNLWWRERIYGPLGVKFQHIQDKDISFYDWDAIAALLDLGDSVEDLEDMVRKPIGYAPHRRPDQDREVFERVQSLFTLEGLFEYMQSCGHPICEAIEELEANKGEGCGWDTHRENIMLRRPDTLVIIDPYYGVSDEQV